MSPPEEDWIDLFEAEVLSQIGERRRFETPADLAVHLDADYIVRDHLRYLSDRLAQAARDVEAGESRYIAVSMPPRLGKSSLGSVHFPLWCLHSHPDWPLMLLSHDPGLATGWGRQIRREVEEHGTDLGLRLAGDAGAARDWEVADDLENGVKGGAAVVSRSIRESITGRGAKVMILDDVVKDFADAHSKTTRDFVWDWWTANSRTRLHPPALVVAIGTRWHEDDIIGRLLSPEYPGDPDRWEVISFPAIAEELVRDPATGIVVEPADAARMDSSAAWEPIPDALGREPGEPLLSPIVPDETPEQALERWGDIKQDVGTYAWNAIYQQRPSPAKGSIFDNDWWQYWRPGDLPDFERKITVWDCAFKGTDQSDWVVGQEWGARGTDRYLIRQTRRRMTFTETLAEMRDFILGPAIRTLVDGEEPHEGEDIYRETSHGEVYRVVRGPHSGVHEHAVEDKANGTAVLDVLRAEIPGMVAWSPGQDSKEARARAASPQVEAGNVYLPALADWLADYLSEMKAFPNAAHDDQVDGTTMALLRLRSGGVATPLTPAAATINRGYRNARVGAGLRRR